MVTLVEQHVIKADDERFGEIDAAAFAAKNLYNLGNYTIRQSWLFGGGYIPYNALYHLLKESEAYQALPRKVSQQVLKRLDNNWQGFFAAMRTWRENPERFLGRPKPPGYKPKLQGRFLLTYSDQAISRRWLRKGLIKPSGLDVLVRTRQTDVRQVRIVPRRDHYVVEIVYEREPQDHDLDDPQIAGIDLGIDNLITLTSNQVGFQPLAVNGRGVKSINQYYNQRRAALQAQVGTRSTKRLRRLTVKRNRKIKHWLHVASRRVIDHLVARGIGTLVIGYNPLWKQQVNLGRVNNQKFVSIPHHQLIKMLTYKAQLAGIQVILQDEGYTSKCSFLDGEYPQKQAQYAGRRIQRGLFRAAGGTLINADVNAAYNIIRKAFPKAFEGIEGVYPREKKTLLRIFRSSPRESCALANGIASIFSETILNL
jgi:putative transposase